jgi:hypothetical protein
MGTLGTKHFPTKQDIVNQRYYPSNTTRTIQRMKAEWAKPLGNQSQQRLGLQLPWLQTLFEKRSFTTFDNQAGIPDPEPRWPSLTSQHPLASVQRWRMSYQDIIPPALFRSSPSAVPSSDKPTHWIGQPRLPSSDILTSSEPISGR